MRGLALTPSRGIPTYEEFYGFHRSPFSLSPDPHFLYRSDSHDEAIRLLLQAIRHDEPFIVLTGDVGAGKTMVSRALIDELDTTTFTSLIVNPFLSIEVLLREVLHDFGIISHDEVLSERVAATSARELTRTLHEFRSSLASLGGKAVLILDEAHHLSPGLLEQIRVIASAETGDTKLLQIVLVGQPRLLDVLSQPETRDLDRHVSLRIALSPMSRPEVEAYVEHRLAVARSSSPLRFDAQAIDAVHRLTGGVPGLMNVLCDRALMLGAQWSAHVITSAMVEDAGRLVELPRPTPSPVVHTVLIPVWKIAGVSVLSLVVLLAALIAFAPLHRLIDAPVPPAPSPPPIRVTPALQPVPVPVDVPPPPPRPRPLPAF